MRYLLAFGFLLTNIVFTNGQDTVNLPLADASDGLTEDGFAEEFRKEYEKRIRKSHINGFYIPTNLHNRCAGQAEQRESVRAL